MRWMAGGIIWVIGLVVWPLLLPALLPGFFSRLNPTPEEFWMVLAESSPDRPVLVHFARGEVQDMYGPAGTWDGPPQAIVCPSIEALPSGFNGGGRFDRLEWTREGEGRYQLVAYKDDLGSPAYAYRYRCDAKGFGPVLAYGQVGPVWVPVLGGSSLILILGFWTILLLILSFLFHARKKKAAARQ